VQLPRPAHPCESERLDELRLEPGQRQSVTIHVVATKT
jgi:hypothetical protein